MSTYGSRLKQERLRLKLTQELFAEAGGVGRYAQGCYERDLSMPRADYLASITLIGVDALYIITGRRTVHRAQPSTGPVSEDQAAEH
ncbi:helix-turn-helix domain-containing protein [Pseudomonas sp. 7P_10.2_Bac1]|uniref:helix-turn-helix domain-containing protein n=1 Tax=Pseudomonas sp. 7P_10.2_Bac1 TaxID=2971614 RepID=UPI0021C56A3F|nr:helix-turn-helix domain-containing protein [Pseudomonas sp. 7P_10.2_Bac1]MCU1725437.1 helix-turn-helix domain-containing protein [Pseudomonas sp. 7P_10.2_Bac1]